MPSLTERMELAIELVDLVGASWSSPAVSLADFLKGLRLLSPIKTKIYVGENVVREG